MTYVDLTAIEATPLTADPYDYMVVPDCISATGLVAANRDYPDIDTPGNKDLEELQYGPGFQGLIDELESPELRQAISDKFNVDLDDAWTTITVRKFCEPSDGNIHTDHWSKVITVLVYFNTDWDNNTGQLRLLRSPDDIEDYAAEVPPAGGTLLAFRRTDISWHGHKRFVGERRMLQLNFVKTGRTARYTQQFARFSTRMMKRVARLVQ